MRFKITLANLKNNRIIPVNYQYPIQAVIYKILARADADYASFLHEKGYSVKHSLKRFKLFTFSDISCPFQIKGDRLYLKDNIITFLVSFHLPEASSHFIKGLFLSQEIDIADKKSKASFKIISAEVIKTPFLNKDAEEVITMIFKPLSPCVAGIKNSTGEYDFLSPKDVRFPLAIQYNWHEKLKTLEYLLMDEQLKVNVRLLEKEPKSRLVWIKAFTPAQTKIRGFMNFEMELTGKRKYIEVLYNSGVGIYNAMGMGCVEVVQQIKT